MGERIVLFQFHCPSLHHAVGMKQALNSSSEGRKAGKAYAFSIKVSQLGRQEDYPPAADKPRWLSRSALGGERCFFSSL